MHYFRLAVTLMFLAIALSFHGDKAVSAIEKDLTVTDDTINVSKGGAVTTAGGLINFQRDIIPILKENCLSCHGAEDAKNDFRVDDHDIMMDFIEAGDSELSSLYTDYLTTDDPDMLMPPPSKGGPLSTNELALIRVWIDEGASWPDDAVFLDGETDQQISQPKQPEPETLDLQTRIWMAQGFLHPATVHFPIALLTVGGFFVILGWKWPSVGTQIPLASLLLGSLTAIISTLMGWAFAPEQGYGNNWASLDFDKEVDMHRWSAVVVCVASTTFAIIALLSLITKSKRLTKIWKSGLLLSAAMVGAVGHQGGEMSYGKDFYPRAIRILLGQPTPTSSPPVADGLSNTETSD